jgi:hypothetical protein
MYYKTKTKTIKEAVSHINSDLKSYFIQPDMEYLKGVLSLRRYTYSKAQEEFANTLEEFYSSLGAVVERDTYGNVYVTKGESNLYPCMVAHLDINQTKRDNVTLHVSGDIMFGFDSDEGVQAGMGADDGCGIALAYEMFKRFENIKLFFPLNEESGCKGSHACDPTFFTDCSMILQGDRRSYTTDLITYTNGIEVCSKEFVNAASDIMDRFGYSENRGVCTDVGTIKADPIVDCIGVNISVSYFNEHSDEEVISIKAYYNAVNFTYELIKELGNQKWHHVHKPTEYFKSTQNNQNNQLSLNFKNNRNEKDPFSDDWYSDDNIYTSDDRIVNNYNKYWNNHNSDFTGVSTNVNKKYTHLDVVYNDYVLDTYTEMKDLANRDDLISYTQELDDLKEEGWDQSEIDSLLSQEICPMCMDDIEISNELLLNIICHSCGCTFNVSSNLI